MAMTQEPWSARPNVDPLAFPAWAKHKAAATGAFKEANLAAAQAKAVLAQMTQLRGAGAEPVVVKMRMDDTTGDAVYETESDGGLRFKWDAERLKWSKDVYGMAATRSDPTLWLMATDERRFGIPAMVAEHAGDELLAIRDEASQAGAPFGNLPDEILRRVLGWLLRLQPLRYPNPEMAVALGNMAACGIAFAEMFCTMFPCRLNTMVRNLARTAQRQGKAAMDRDPSYLKALHRQYRAVDIQLRHSAACEAAETGVDLSDGDQPDVMAHFLENAQLASAFWECFQNDNINLPLVVIMSATLLMTTEELATHLGHRRSQLLLPPAERSFFSPVTLHKRSSARGAVPGMAMGFSMVPFDPGTDIRGQWLKISLRWFEDGGFRDNQAVWFEEMDPANGDHLEIAPSGFATALAKIQMLALARKALAEVFAAGYDIESMTAAQGCMHWLDDSATILAAIVPKGMQGPRVIMKDFGHFFR